MDNDIIYEQDGLEHQKTVLPRTNEKPIEFFGSKVYENSKQMNRYLCIYKTSARTITTRYVVYNIYSYGGYDKTYRVSLFDSGKEAFDFICKPDNVEFTFNASHYLDISLALDCCEPDHLI